MKKILFICICKKKEIVVCSVLEYNGRKCNPFSSSFHDPTKQAAIENFFRSNAAFHPSPDIFRKPPVCFTLSLYSSIHYYEQWKSDLFRLHWQLHRQKDYDRWKEAPSNFLLPLLPSFNHLHSQDQLLIECCEWRGDIFRSNRTTIYQ